MIVLMDESLSSEMRVFDSLRSVVVENVILERFTVISRRSTLNVRFCRMSRFQADTRLFVWLRFVVAENFISKRFRVMSRRWTFNRRFCWMSRLQGEKRVFYCLRYVQPWSKHHGTVMKIKRENALR